MKIAQFIFSFLLMMFLCGLGCSSSKQTPDPLAGWRKDYTPQASDQIIEKDYQAYIHALSPDEQKFIGPIFYYKDGTGQHAVRIEVDIGGKDCWYHVLFYDKEIKRIKVVKYFYGRYQS